MANTVYIPSRGRTHHVQKLVRGWAEQAFDVVFMVEPGEHDAYCRAVREANPYSVVWVRALPDSNRGIGFSRARCMEDAYDNGLEAIVLSDDDVRPVEGMYKMIVAAEHHHVLGVTARYSYHDLCLGPKIKGQSDLILQPTGTWRIVSLNVENVLSIGNYDESLTCAEDGDLMLRGLDQGFPWMVHLGTKAGSIGKRYEPGGLSAFCDNKGIDDILSVGQVQFHEKWPDFVSAPPAKYRVAWKRAYDKMLPEWKEWSWLHGGDLGLYLGEG